MTTKQVQLLLAYLGYEVDPDGIPGKQTQKAVYTFQKEYDITPVDGDAGPITNAALVQAVADGWQRPTEKQDVPDTNVGSTGTFWDEIDFWTRAEFGCQCKDYKGPYCDGFPVEPDESLVRLADRVRKHFGRPAHRSSGIRCKQHNADSGGVWNSKHMSGKALDFFVEGVSGQQLLAYVQAQPETNYAYIISGQYVHMDVD